MTLATMRVYVSVAKQYHNNKLQSVLSELFVQLNVSSGERSFLLAEASSTHPPIQMHRTIRHRYVDTVSALVCVFLLYICAPFCCNFGLLLH